MIPLALSSGEVVTGLSYLVGAGVFLWAARRRRLATEGMAILAGVGFVAGIVGAKVTQLVASGLPLSAAANPGGRALLGGLLFGWLGVEIAKRGMGIRRSTGDLFALALPAGEAVGRIGCHLNGCCYGTECALPWSIWQHGALRHPAQLYSAATAAAIFVLLLWVSERGTVGEGVATPAAGSRVGTGASDAYRLPAPMREGDLFRLYLLLFGVTRFGLEFVRWRESLVMGLSPMQWFCLDLVVVASIGLLRRKKHDVPELRPGV